MSIIKDITSIGQYKEASGEFNIKVSKRSGGSVTIPLREGVTLKINPAGGSSSALDLEYEINPNEQNELLYFPNFSYAGKAIRADLRFDASLEIMTFVGGDDIRDTRSTVDVEVGLQGKYGCYIKLGQGVQAPAGGSTYYPIVVKEKF